MRSSRALRGVSLRGPPIAGQAAPSPRPSVPRAPYAPHVRPRTPAGVIPGRGPSPDPAARRCTLMVAFWRDLRCRAPCDGQLGAAMPMPRPPPAESHADNGGGCSGSGAAWLQMLAPLPGAAAWAAGPAPATVVPAAFAPVWEPLEPGGSAKAPSYDACFQGF